MQKTSSFSLNSVFEDFSQISFKESEDFYYSARNKCVYYNKKQAETELGTYQLLHELGHALSEHHHFESGIELVKMESEAWQKAKKIAEQYEIEIPDDLIEHCLDSYRDWLHLRSTCPNCNNIALETDISSYKCFNCHQKWTVPANQKNRCYRLKANLRK